MGKGAIYEHRCLFCEESFTSKRSHSKFCSNNCSKKNSYRERPKFYEYLCSIKFGKIFGKKLSKMNLYSYQFDGGSFNNFNILTEYKSATYNGPSNYSNAEESLIKMIIAELKHGKPVLKVVVFYSKKLDFYHQYF